MGVPFRYVKKIQRKSNEGNFSGFGGRRYLSAGDD